jgi:hypothetical protein
MVDNLVLREAELRKLSRPSKRMYRNFMDFMYTEHPFSDSDERFVYHEHDFVSLEKHEENWLDELMHRFMNHCKTGILRVRCTILQFLILIARLTLELVRPSSFPRRIKLRQLTIISTTIQKTAWALLSKS